MTRPNDVYLPPIVSRVLIRWMLYTAATATAIGVYIVVTDPVNRGNVVPGGLFVAVIVAAMLWHSTWVDPVDGAVTVVRCRLYRRRIPLLPDTEVALVLNGRGDALLRLRRPGTVRCLYIQLLRRDLFVEKSLDPALLHLLADTLERHAPTGTDAGTPQVVALLRAQAEHTAAGGPVDTSPLATAPAEKTGRATFTIRLDR